MIAIAIAFAEQIVVERIAGGWIFIDSNRESLKDHSTSLRRSHYNFRAERARGSDHEAALTRNGSTALDILMSTGAPTRFRNERKRSRKTSTLNFWA